MEYASAYGFPSDALGNSTSRHKNGWKKVKNENAKVLGNAALICENDLFKKTFRRLNSNAKTYTAPTNVVNAKALRNLVAEPTKKVLPT